MTKTSKSGGTAGNIFGLIGIYILIYIVCSVMFVGLFHTGLLKNMEVLMYRGIAFIVITGIVAAVVMGVIRKFWGFITIRDIIMMFVIFCCVNTVLFVLVPVTVERSVSVFMLSYMEENSDRPSPRNPSAKYSLQSMLRITAHSKSVSTSRSRQVRSGRILTALTPSQRAVSSSLMHSER